MNRLSILLLGALSLPALAQPVAPAGAAQPAQAAAIQSAADPKPALQPTALGVNPFTGKALSVEEQLRQLEQMKLQTAAMEEQLRQANLQEDARNVPVRKEVERTQAQTSMLKEQVAQRELRNNAGAPRSSAEPTAGAEVAKPVKQPKPAKKPASKGPEVSEAVKPVQPVAKPVPTVTSVFSVGGAKAAVLSSAEGSTVVRTGEMSPWGRVTSIQDDAVSLDGKKLAVHNRTLSRVTLSDVVQAPAAQASASTSSMPSSGGIQPPTYRSGSVIPVRELPPPPIPDRQ